MAKALKQHYEASVSVDHKSNEIATLASSVTNTDANKKGNKEKEENAELEANYEDEAHDSITKELTQAFVSLKEQVRESRRHLQTWHHRHLALQEILYEDLRATNEQEKHGKYSEDDFPLYPLLKQIERFRKQLSLPLSFEEEIIANDYTNPNPHDNHEKEGKAKQHQTALAKWFNLKELMKEDEVMKELFAPLLGTKESTIIVACHNAIHRSDDYLKEHHHHSHEGDGAGQHNTEECRDQNIMAWVTLKMLYLWYETKLQQIKPNRVEELEMEMDEEDYEDRIANGELTEEELDDLRAEAMNFVNPEPSTASHTNNPLSSTWFKKAKENLSIMHIVAQETKRKLLPSNNQDGGHGSTTSFDGSKSTMTDRSLPGANFEIGPPVISRSALFYKEPENKSASNTPLMTSNTLALESFSLDNTGKTIKKSQSAKSGDLTQLSQLKDIDPFGKAKKSKKMMTMKAHLHNIHSKTSDTMEIAEQIVADYEEQQQHHHTMPVSISTSALQSSTKSNQKLLNHGPQSTGQLKSNNKNALAYTSHL